MERGNNIEGEELFYWLHDESDSIFICNTQERSQMLDDILLIGQVKERTIEELASLMLACKWSWDRIYLYIDDELVEDLELK